jgi:hypothetical protein
MIASSLIRTELPQESEARGETLNNFNKQKTNRQHPWNSLSENILIANQNWREKMLGKYRADEERADFKRGYGKNQTKTKSTVKNSGISCGRFDGIVAPKTPAAMSSVKSTPTNRTYTNRDYKSLGYIHNNPVSCRHTQATKRANEENKKDRKQSVIGSLMSILGPEDESSTSALSFEAGRRISLHGAPNFKRSNEQTKKDRKQRVVGSVVSILRPEEGLLRVCRDKNTVTSGKKSTENIVTAATNKSTRNNRKRQTSLHIAQPSKRRDENKIQRKESVFRSLILILGPKEESPITPDGRVHLTSGTKPRQTAASAVSSLTKSNPEKDEHRIMYDKPKSSNKKKFYFDESKARELIRAKLRKNQQKYAALAAAPKD